MKFPLAFLSGSVALGLQVTAIVLASRTGISDGVFGYIAASFVVALGGILYGWLHRRAPLRRAGLALSIVAMSLVLAAFLLGVAGLLLVSRVGIGWR